MLLRFGFSNFLSFKSYQEISFVATPLKDDEDCLVVSPALSEPILPCLAVYGANASGKSNLLAAFDYMTNMVRNSQTKIKPESKLHRPSFKLGNDANNLSTRMDCDIVLNSVRYHYGFEFNEDEISSEWLYAYPKRKRQVMFFRQKGESFFVGELMPKKTLARECFKFVRSNSLFLSAAAQNNHRLAVEIYDWFDNVVFYSRNRRVRDVGSLWDDEETRDFIIKVIKEADPSITGGHVEEEPVPEEAKKFFSSFDELIKSSFPEIDWDVKRDMNRQLKLHHRGETGEVLFEPELESGGTKSLLQLLGPLRSVLRAGGLLIVDELEANLHALLTIKLISFFLAPSVNKLGAQLWFVTHDTNLLCHSSLRRDQIWFAEKSKIGETTLYSLAELSIRKTDNIERGYLNGRFGAIPFFGSVENLLETDRAK